MCRLSVLFRSPRRRGPCGGCHCRRTRPRSHHSTPERTDLRPCAPQPQRRRSPAMRRSPNRRSGAHRSISGSHPPDGTGPGICRSAVGSPELSIRRTVMPTVRTARVPATSLSGPYPRVWCGGGKAASLPNGSVHPVERSRVPVIGRCTWDWAASGRRRRGRHPDRSAGRRRLRVVRCSLPVPLKGR